MLEEMVDDVAEKGSFTDTCLAHNDNGNVKPYSLHHEAHLEEVVNIYNISFLTVDLVVPVARDVRKDL